MIPVEASHAVESFADRVAVDDLSFSVACGEMFGIIGPDGADKTITLKMIMDIIITDSGQVTILAEKLSEATKNRPDYTSEERGLYKKLSVLECRDWLIDRKTW